VNESIGCDCDTASECRLCALLINLQYIPVGYFLENANITQNALFSAVYYWYNGKWYDTVTFLQQGLTVCQCLCHDNL